jgi:2-hydroxy-6-oxonona-2,4-dienedioate hydrolase
MHDKSKVTDELVDVRFAIYSQPGFLDAMRNIMCLQDLDVRTRNLITDAELRTVEAPTLVVWTTHDPTGAVEVGQRFADTVPDGRLVVIDNAGHWPQFEQAEEFNALHLEFLLGKSLHAKNRVPEASARPTH